MQHIHITIYCSPILMQDASSTQDKFNLVHNIIIKNDIKPTDYESQKKIFVCLTVSKESLFLEEFLKRFVEQDFDKNKMVLHLTSDDEANLQKAGDYLDKFHFR